ncbi:MAG TPA: Mov34/MPN/PAD-1 family protein [Polyangiaceae bacterium]|nr:Mov34/MPN/PAD-1 family protein [Polyangiaceae bacterium]
MLTIRIAPEAALRILRACERAGIRETGGMLLAEHAENEVFRVLDVTTAEPGRFASFIRALTDGFKKLDRFFQRTGRDYTRFNYLGEWHSHPSFALRPSAPDDTSMFEIVNDPETRARFAVLVIVRVDGGELRGGAWAYFPPESREDCELVIERAQSGG